MPRASQKDAILEHGTQILMNQGYQGAGVADITSAAGVPKGSFYNHFPSKEAFAAEVLERYFAAFGPLFDRTLGDETRTGLERIRAMADGLAEAVVATGYKGCLMGIFAADASVASDVLREAVNRRFRGWRRALARAVEAGQADGSVTTRMPADALASLVISAFEGAALRAKAERAPAALDDFRHAIPALLAR